MDSYEQVRGLLNEAGDDLDQIPGALIPNGLTASQTHILVSQLSALRRKVAEAEVAIQLATRVSQTR